MNHSLNQRAARLIVAIGLTTLLVACGSDSSDAPKPAETSAPQRANDFPTLTRVEFVLECMQEQGGQSRDNLYHCVCAADKVAEKMDHETYAQAQTFTYNFGTPGERGAEFRDPPQSATLRNALKDAKAEAAAACFLKPVGKADGKK